jgi:glycerol-3-phosphate dehydrogenase
MKIGYLGAGTWGFCLASLLASKGHEVVLWAQREDFARHLSKRGNTLNLPIIQQKRISSLQVTWKRRWLELIS